MSRNDPTLWTRLSIGALAAAMFAAGVIYLVSASQAVKAERELEAFRDFAVEQAKKERDASVPRNITPVWPATISPANHDRLDILQIRFQSAEYRRGLALGFVTRGSVLLLALGCFYFLVRKTEPNQPSEPTAMSVTPPAAQEPRQP